MPLPRFITFDCYDTLVEFPIERATEAILGSRMNAVDRDDFFAAFEKLRYATTTYRPYQPYRDVLAGTLAEAMGQFGLTYQEADGVRARRRGLHLGSLPGCAACAGTAPRPLPTGDHFQ